MAVTPHPIPGVRSSLVAGGTGCSACSVGNHRDRWVGLAKDPRAHVVGWGVGAVRLAQHLQVAEAVRRGRTQLQGAVTVVRAGMASATERSPVINDPQGDGSPGCLPCGGGSAAAFALRGL